MQLLFGEGYKQYKLGSTPSYKKWINWWAQGHGKKETNAFRKIMKINEQSIIVHEVEHPKAVVMNRNLLTMRVMIHQTRELYTEGGLNYHFYACVYVGDCF